MFITFIFLYDVDVTISFAGMTRDDLFNTNATLVKNIAVAVSKSCPKALVAVITNPVNSCVPIFCETMRKVILVRMSKDVFNVIEVQRYTLNNSWKF